MSRRLIIILLVILIIGIVGGTVTLLVRRFSTPAEEEIPGTTQPQGSDGLTPAEIGRQQIANPTADDDNDGLTNADESLWGTDSNNPDTDGDGFLDGEEVAANHNPTITGPNDLLPEGFTPGLDLQPLAAAPLQVDQFFVDNLDLSGGSQNLTELYQRQVPEEQRTPDTLFQFAERQPIITRLPTPAASSITLEQTDTPLVMAEYLDVAGDLSAFSNREIIGLALNRLYEHDDPSEIVALAQSVRRHQQRLTELRVPPAAQGLQRLLLGYSELLAATYEQMGLYNEDPVKSVVGMRQLEEADSQYIPLLKREIARLETLSAQLRNAAFGG